METQETESREEDGDINKPQSWGSKLTSVNMGLEIHKQAKDHNISLRDAIEFGVKFKIADKDGWDYPDTNLQIKMEKIIKHRNALIQEVEALREQVPKVDHTDEDKAVADDVFGNIETDGEKDGR